MTLELRPRAQSAIDAAQSRDVPAEALDELIITEGHVAASGRRGTAFGGR